MKTEQERSAALIRLQGLAGQAESNLNDVYVGMRAPLAVQAGHDFDGAGIGGGDPTGNCVAEVYGPGPTEVLAEMDMCVDVAIGWVERLLDAQKRYHNPERSPTSSGPGDMWCVSCWRNSQKCEAINAHYAGRRLCRWCGDFAGTHEGRRPPLSLLEHRHAGHRISQQMVDEALIEELVLQQLSINA